VADTLSIGRQIEGPLYAITMRVSKPMALCPCSMKKYLVLVVIAVRMQRLPSPLMVLYTPFSATITLARCIITNAVPPDNGLSRVRLSLRQGPVTSQQSPALTAW